MRAAVLLLVLLLAPLPAGEALRLAMSSWAAWTPAIAGEAQGLWRALGLEVTVQVLANDEQVRLALAEGRVELALGMIGNHVGGIIAGQDLVILGEADWSHGGDKVLIRRGLKPADLRGATVGIYLDQPSVRWFLHCALTANQLGDGDVRVEQVVDTSALADAFVAGKYPLVVDFDPEALRAVREGDGRVLASSATFPGVIPEGFAMRRGVLAPEVLERFFRGWFAAVAWARDPANWPAYVALMRARVFGARTTEADLLAMVAAVRIHDRATALARNAPAGGLERWLGELTAWLRAGGSLPATWDSGRVVDTTAFRAAAAP